tara:strand:- start:322 stop:564 length:243 start_codon:yes stop_codon:yes gene_type:complete
MYNISKFLGVADYIYSKENLYNYYLEEVKNNLKPTQTLKKKFYIPTKNEIQNKSFMIRIKNKPKIIKEQLIECKKNLKKN